MGATFKMIEVVGTSDASYAEAIRSAIAEASKTIHDMSWFEVVEMRGSIDNGQVKEFQVKVNIGFKLVR